MARRSIRDRNSAAIAPELIEPVDVPAEQPPAVPTAAPAEVAPTAEASSKRQPATPKKKQASAPGDTDRLGIYLTPTEFDDARAAYLADWSNGGEADTFGKWIAAAIEAYAARTPDQRATAQPRVRADERTGSTRSFAIPTDTVAQLRAAITADQRAGRWPSDSAWCGEAIARAVESARQANGGSLPIPPARLPNRLAR